MRHYWSRISRNYRLQYGRVALGAPTSGTQMFSRSRTRNPCRKIFRKPGGHTLLTSDFTFKKTIVFLRLWTIPKNRDFFNSRSKFFSRGETSEKEAKKPFFSTFRAPVRYFLKATKAKGGWFSTIQTKRKFLFFFRTKFSRFWSTLTETLS